LFLLFQPSSYMEDGSVYKELLQPWKTRETVHLQFFEQHILV
jgi:hypothetical protein